MRQAMLHTIDKDAEVAAQAIATIADLATAALRESEPGSDE